MMETIAPISDADLDKLFGDLQQQQEDNPEVLDYLMDFVEPLGDEPLGDDLVKSLFGDDYNELELPTQADFDNLVNAAAELGVKLPEVSETATEVSETEVSATETEMQAPAVQQLPPDFKFDKLSSRKNYRTDGAQNDQRYYRPKARLYHLNKSKNKGKFSPGQRKDIAQAGLKALLCKLVESHPDILNTINSSGIATIEITDNLPLIQMADPETVLNHTAPRDFLIPEDFTTT